ncbi:futalosine hydrolase [Deinococcus pimensis]|uniref:futalosine hydrolase n=1 Tax=Deinococcus pimensis TaxID=309888 RepID=UPI0004AE7AC8|nr:futalosine hydrolase [Deinococcus pimensis]
MTPDLPRALRPALVVATEAEAAPLRDFGVPVAVSGIGAVNAALATTELIASERADLVVNVGIAGAYDRAGLRPGDLVVASEVIYGALGAVDGARFLPLDELGFPLLPGLFNRLPVWTGSEALARALGAAFGPVVTVETVTGDAGAARVLQDRWPGALAEGMEGAGAAHAALRLGVPCVELRGVSNAVGPRDRSSWEIGGALRAVRGALRTWLT